MKKHWTGGLAAAALSAAAATAAPFQPSDVAAEAAWVVHVDVDGLRGTRIGEFLLDEMNREDADAKLNAVKVVFNFDPREDLHGATLYGVDNRPDGAVAVFRGRIDIKRLVTLVKANPSYQAEETGARTLHSWIDENKPEAKRVYAGFHGEDTLAISEGRDRVIRALDVLDGRAKALPPDSGLVEPARNLRAAFFVAAADLADLPEISPEAAMLRKARSLQVAIAAPGEDLEARLRLEADSAGTAEMVEQVLNGILAFARLNDADQPELARLAADARVDRDGSFVGCRIRHPVDAVVEHLAREAERKRQAETL